MLASAVRPFTRSVCSGRHQPTPSRSLVMDCNRAAKSGIELVVKGDPVAGTLGDCPFCHRVLLTLAAKGIDYDMTFVDFASKPQWLLDASGGKVPVLIRKQPDDLIMPDSDVITAWADKEFPSPSMASDVDPSVGAKLFPAFRAFLSSASESPEEVSGRDALEAELKIIDNWLSQPGKGPLFGGQTLNATDAAVAPKLYHIQVALPHYKKFTIPDELKAVHAYLKAVKELPAWKATDYGEASIIAGWGKHH